MKANRKPMKGNRRPMKKKAKTYTYSWWIGNHYVPVTFNSQEDMDRYLNYLDHLYPEKIKEQMPIKDVYDILGKKLAKLEEVSNKLKEI
jgi:hypothetical protein